MTREKFTAEEQVLVLPDPRQDADRGQTWRRSDNHSKNKFFVVTQLCCLVTCVFMIASCSYCTWVLYRVSLAEVQCASGQAATNAKPALQVGGDVLIFEDSTEEEDEMEELEEDSDTWTGLDFSDEEDLVFDETSGDGEHARHARSVTQPPHVTRKRGSGKRRGKGKNGKKNQQKPKKERRKKKAKVSAAHYLGEVSDDEIRAKTQRYNHFHSTEDCQHVAEMKGFLCRNRTFAPDSSLEPLRIFKAASWVKNETSPLTLTPEGKFIVKYSGIIQVYAQLSFDDKLPMNGLILQQRRANLQDPVQELADFQGTFPGSVTGLFSVKAGDTLEIYSSTDQSLVKVNKGASYFGAMQISYEK